MDSVPDPEPDEADDPDPAVADLLDVSELPVEAFDALVLLRSP